MTLPLATFQPESLLQSDGANAARLSTIWRMYPKEMLAKNWPAAFQRLLARWRSRIRTFRAHDVIKGKRYLVSANCLPHAFNMKHQPSSPRFCHRDDLCPWCHMRAVHKTYDLVRRVVAASRVRETNLALYSLRRIDRVALPASPIPRLLRIQREALSAAWIHQRSRISPGQAIGAMWKVTIAPGVGRHKNAWEITGRCLVLSSRQEPLITFQRWEGSEVGTDSEGLQKAIAAYLRYPVGLLKGNPDVTVEGLQIRAAVLKEYKIRYSGRSGEFRTTKE